MLAGPFRSGVRKEMSLATTEDWKSIEKSATHLELGRQLENLLGTAVFEARQLDVNRRIHVRVCPLGDWGLGADQVKRSVAKLRSLDHPGLPKVFGGGAAGEAAYVETEPVRGMLPDALCARRLSPRQKLEVVVRICDTLAYLHAEDIRYGALVPRGVVVQRRIGSLRLDPKLVRFEAMGVFRPDGSDQRAFGAFVAAILGPAGDDDSDLDRKLRDIASRCASTTTDSPTFAELLETLRPLLIEQTARFAMPIIHLAEPLRLQIPPPQVAPNAGHPTSRGKQLAAISIGTFVSLVVLTSILDRHPNRGNSPVQKNMPLPRYEAPPPVVRRETTDIQPRSAPFNDRSEQGARRLLDRERTYRFTPALLRSARPMGFDTGMVDSARSSSTGTELAEDAIELSEPSWAKGLFGEPELSVQYWSNADLSSNLRIIWIIESNGERQYEARLFPRVTSRQGKLKGEISSVSTGRLRPPLTTYLAEDPIGFGEPRRVSNILTIPEVSDE
jgi:hypothetical protein